MGVRQIAFLLEISRI